MHGHARTRRGASFPGLMWRPRSCRSIATELSTWQADRSWSSGRSMDTACRGLYAATPTAVSHTRRPHKKELAALAAQLVVLDQLVHGSTAIDGRDDALPPKEKTEPITPALIHEEDGGLSAGAPMPSCRAARRQLEDIIVELEDIIVEVEIVPGSMSAGPTRPLWRWTRCRQP